MRTLVGLWRWRRNTLRRGTDLAEAWVALAAVVLLVLGTPATGWLSGSLIDSSLQRKVHAQQADRQRTKVVVTGLPREQHHSALDAESATSHKSGDRVAATWRAPDGGVRSGTLNAPVHNLRPGDTFTVWADRQGRPVASPMNGTNARINAGVAGFGTAVLAAALVECCRRLVVWRLEQRRYRQLDRAWAEAGPDWGRTGAGS